MVEQLTLNQWVLGSSPWWCTMWPVGQAVKTLASHASNRGSNPLRVTKMLFGILKNVYIVGINDDEVPPVPIPNTEVKLIGAEDTWRAAAWENRKMPTLIFLNSSVGRACGC